MIPRYTRPAMGRIWSDENKFRKWLEVELAASEALAEIGEVPAEAAKALRQNADFDVRRIQEIESQVKHDVIAFTTAVSEKMSAAGAADASRWFHYGLTSNDVVDTAQALQIKDASEIIQADLDELRQVLRERAFEFKDTVIIGRTHGVHAEPTTFGLKIANWYAEVDRHVARFEAAGEQIRVGKISGAVGTFAHISPRAEERICEKLGLEPAPISSQVIQRDRHAHYLVDPGAHRRHAGKNRPRSASLAADRGSRSAGIFLEKAEGQLGDAAQKKSHHLRADLRTGPGGALECSGRL